MTAVVHQVAVGGYDHNFSYLVYCSVTRKGIVVDPCGDIEKVFALIAEHNVELMYIFNTHSHFDHVEKNDAVQKKYNVPVVMHKDEPYTADKYVVDTEEIQVGELTFKFLHTPGHTPGCVCIAVEDHLFSGDVLFVGACGRCDFDGGDAHAMYDSLQRLAALPESTKIYPGHDYGDVPISSIGREKRTNRFLIVDKPSFLRLHGIG